MRVQSAFLIFIVVLYFVPCCASPQSLPGSPLEKYLITFDLIPSPNFGIVTQIIRDDRGFLWFGTTKGLCKYDGYQVKIISVGIPDGYRPQVIVAMTLLNQDSLLLASINSLWVLRLSTEQSSPLQTDIDFSGTRILSMTKDLYGAIWIGTNSQGLYRLDPHGRKGQRFTTHNGLSEDNITTLLADHSGKIWIGTLGGGLNVLSGEDLHPACYRSKVSDAHSLWSDHILALSEVTPGEIWIGTDLGLNILDMKTGSMRREIIPSSVKNPIRSIAQDGAGRTWIAASDLGLISCVGGVYNLLSAPETILHSMNAIAAIYPDPVASDRTSLLLWVGTRNGLVKISIIKNPFFIHVRDPQSLPLNIGAVLSLCKDHTQALWLGLWGGGLEELRLVNGVYKRVAHFDKDSKPPLSLPNNDVESICEDRDGSLWIGTSTGLAVFDPKRIHITRIMHRDGDSTSIISNDIARIYEDKKGTVWICSDGGLSSAIPGKSVQFRNYLHSEQNARIIHGNMVSDILEDRFSNLWVSTYGNGLMKIHSDGTMTGYPFQGDSVGDKKNRVYTFVDNGNGIFWLSTDVGLVSFDTGSGEYKRYPIHELYDGHIFGIATDRNGDLWLSTSTGLVRFNPSTRSVLKYDEAHGLPFRELTSLFFRDESGKLLVGGLDGFTEFYPDSVSTISRPPVIAITTFSLFDKEIAPSVITSGSIQLGYDQNFFSFSFAALDYANPLLNRFAYRMTGVDEHWVDAGTRNYASYTNLDPGHYLFQVKGCNSNNVWNEAGTSIEITIVPPYWRTWWFRLLLAMVASLSVYLVYRYRLRRILEVERLRLRIADDLHDDVGSNLSTIAMASRSIQLAPETTPAMKNKLMEIYDTAITTSEGMKDIVWFIKPRNDTLDNLLLRMKDAASAVLADIEHHFYVPDHLSGSRISIDFKRNFFLGFKEVLTNIVKHAAASRVEIQIRNEEGKLEMIVRDNGKGFDPTPAGMNRRGNGLDSLRSRARDIGGVCEIISHPGEGTVVKFSGKI